MSKRNTFLFLAVCIIIIVTIYILNILLKKESRESLSSVSLEQAMPGSIKNIHVQGKERIVPREEKEPVEEPAIPAGEPLLN